jgi:hypothetical protein
MNLELNGIVKGHGFSRAETGQETLRALAPEGRSFFTNLHRIDSPNTA